MAVVAIGGIITGLSVLTFVLPTIITLVQGLGAALAFVAANPIVLIVGAITALVAALWYFRDYVVVVALGIAHGFVKLGSQIRWVLVEVIPAYFMWLVENAGNLFVDLGNLLSSFFANCWINLENFFNSLKNWLSGGAWDFEWTGLLRGFKSTLTKLPEIAARQVGPIEKALMDELTRKMLSAKGRWGWELEEGKPGAGGAGAGGPGGDGPTPNTFTRPGRAKKEKKSGGDELRVSFTGIAESWKALQDAVGQKAKDEKAEAERKHQLSLQEKANKHLETIAENTEMLGDGVLE
jgi:hypothetical protein